MKVDKRMIVPQVDLSAEEKEVGAGNGRLPLPLEIPPKKENITADPPKILAEVVIEEISIDGMCGVY